MTYSDLYGGNWEMFVKGLDGRVLTTSDRQVKMGANNRAFITDYSNDSGSFWAYWHYYLGGTLEFDMNVS